MLILTFLAGATTRGDSGAWLGAASLLCLLSSAIVIEGIVWVLAVLKAPEVTDRPEVTYANVLGDRFRFWLTVDHDELNDLAGRDDYWFDT